LDYPLGHTNGHIIVTVDEDNWLIDTGSPASFGSRALKLDGKTFNLPAGLMGISVGFLAENTGIPLGGLIGTDILNLFDVVFDVPKGLISFHKDAELPTGDDIPLILCMGVPVLEAQINGEILTCFFDTGAQISYAPSRILRPEDAIGPFQDFYPTLGTFETALHFADLVMGSGSFRVRCGVMPDFLAALMSFAGAEGIIGNELMLDQRVCYCPGKGKLIMG